MLSFSPNVYTFKTNTPAKNNVTFQSNKLSGSFDSVSFAANKKDDLEGLKKSKVLSALACLWSKSTKSGSFILNGHIEELKALHKEGTICVYAPKHYDTKDIPSLVKLFDSLSSSVSEFNELFPYFMRKLYKEKKSIPQKMILKIKDNMGGFIVDTEGKGKGKEALQKAFRIVESKKPLMIFPEGVSGLKYSGEPISEEKQEVQPIKNGLSHIISRLIANKQKGEYPKDFKVAVIPIGISGEKGKNGKPASLFVGKPINVFEDLSDKLESKTALYDRIDVLNEAFQHGMQEAQNGAYRAYNAAIE